MIDATRNLSTTYRVDRRLDGIYLRVFPPAPRPVVEAWYRTDQIPQWLIEAMALLDAAAPASIPDLGYRVGELVYWIEPPSRNTAGERTAAALDPNLGQVFIDMTTDKANEVWRKVAEHAKTT